MVSLEDKTTYLEALEKNQQINWFVDFLMKGKINNCPSLNYSDSLTVAKNLFVTVINCDKSKSNEIVEEFSKRVPSKEATWVWNDFVIFSLVTTIKKFNFESKWIRDVLGIMGGSPNKEVQLISKTFLNILTGNLNSKEDYYQISILYQDISKEMQLDQERVNKLFKSLWRNQFPFFKSDFLNLVSLKSIEITFKSKGLLNQQEFFNTTDFVKRFYKRTEIIAQVISWITIIFTGVGIGYYLNLIGINAFLETEIGQWINLISIFGFAIISWLTGLRRIIEKCIVLFIRKLLGFKNIMM